MVGRALIAPSPSLSAFLAVNVRTASRKVLDGIVPVSMQEPPTHRCRSTTATRFPSFAAWTAARCPAGPLPMQMRSYSKDSFIS
jgi:hypothetical protein